MVPRLVEILAARHRALAIALATLVAAAGTFWGSHTAGGADAYGYVSEADLWLRGRLHVDHRFALDAPWPDRLWSFAPLGYRPATTGTDIVPIYSAGLPLMMAAAKAVAGHCAMFLVVPLLGGVLVLATYAIGVRLGRPVVGLTAAWLVATSPTMLFMLMAPMSDVPVAAAWALALAAVLGRSSRSALAAGFAAGLAILIRPNLAPALIVVAGWAAWRDRGWRPAALVVAGALPGIIAVALINHTLYGSPWRSGYEHLGRLFRASHVVPNVTNYFGWLFTVETLLAIGLLALLLPRRRWRRSADERTATVLLAAFLVAAWIQYFPYSVFDQWWFMRFLLPGWPALAFGTATILASIARTPERQRLAAAVIVAAGLWGLYGASSRHVFRMAQGESKYTEVAAAAASIVPPDGVILSMQHSGSLRYYAGRMTLRWDFLDPAWLDRAVEWLAGRGHRPFLVLERWEAADLRRHFAARSQVGRLDWEPLATFRNGEVLIYDPLRRDNRAAPTVIPERPREFCALPAPMAEWSRR